MSLKGIVEQIGKMSVMELADLIKEVETTFGVSAAAVAAPAAAAVSDAPAAVEKNEFKVVLQNSGSDKIKAIKALKSVTNLSLGDAKKAVEEAPYVIGEQIAKEEAQKIKKTMEEAGAKVDLV